MNIWIEHNALVASSESDIFLRPGVLYSLFRLQDLGHQIGFNSEELSDHQIRLLENENIEPDFATPAYAESAIEIEESDEDPGTLLQLSSNDATVIESEEWPDLIHKICFPERKTTHERKTTETEIYIQINLDGSGKSNIDTGIGILDHMLEQVSKHALIDLSLQTVGDLEVDEHHTIEDTAIALGTAIEKALGNKTGIQRYGFILPMDESQAYAALDLSGRPYLKFDGSFSREKVGEFPTEMVQHFFYSLVINMNATLHIRVEGENDHHKIEACFKAFARSLRSCISRSERNLNILPSTKDLL